MPQQLVSYRVVFFFGRIVNELTVYGNGIERWMPRWHTVQLTSHQFGGECAPAFAMVISNEWKSINELHSKTHCKFLLSSFFAIDHFDRRLIFFRFVGT